VGMSTHQIEVFCIQDWDDDIGSWFTPADPDTEGVFEVCFQGASSQKGLISSMSAVLA
jgi:hypothetical protein